MTIRILLIHNQDYGADGGSQKRGDAARAGVAQTARATESALRMIPGADVLSCPVDSPASLIALLDRQPGLDLVFNLCESLRGDPRYEIPVPVILESRGIPYTGNKPLALRIALDKAHARARLAAAGVPVPLGVVIATDSEVDQLEGPLPAIVKPSREDGSIGIDSGSVVRDRTALRRRTRYVLERLKQPAIVEAFIEGREFNVSVLGDDAPVCLPIAEMDFSAMPADEPRIVSYRAKWNIGAKVFKGSVPMFGLEKDGALARSLRRAALGAFRALELRDYARIDLRVDATGRPFVIDVNPNCDLAPDAGFIKAAACAQIEYSHLIHRLVGFAIGRGKRHATATAQNRRSSVPA